MAAEFVPNPEIKQKLARAALESASDAGDVLVEETRSLIESGSEERRSEPGQPPRDQSGELRDSIQILDSSLMQNGARVRVGTNLIKAWWLEFGTASMAPRPFLRPAFQEARPRMLAQFQNLKEEIS